MSSKTKGKLVLYSGSSGVGKGTILKELMKRDGSIRLSVSNTTRPPRTGEVNGVHYNFLTKDEFEKIIAEDGYLEYATYCNHYYGTPKKQLEKMLGQGYNVFLEIEVQGALQVMEKYPEILSIFIMPPSIETLEERLRGRGTEDEETVQKRLNQAKNEIAFKDQYKHVVVNDDLDRAVDDVLRILQSDHPETPAVPNENNAKR